jgi:phosphate:Na+ symporter
MQTLLNILAGVALLIWGTHIVRTGIMRVYGADLRRLLANSIGNRFAAFGAGIGVTALVQSSTATALITSSFVGQGLIATAPALAIMLGADVGTALVVQVLSLDLYWLSPVLIVVGVTVFIGGQNKPASRLGRIAIGLGLIILALQLIMQAVRPLAEAAGVQVIFSTLTGDHGLDMVIAAGLVLLLYSSLAVVLLVATFAAAGVLGGETALGLVLGANLGGGLLAIMATARSTAEAKRVAFGNFFFKAVGCMMFLPFVDEVGLLLAHLGDPQTQVVAFHLMFNLAIAMVFIGLIGPIAKALERLLPVPAQRATDTGPRYLDPIALETPALAISCAAREALRLGDMTETMLRGFMTALLDNDLRAVETVKRLDDDVDDLYTAIKLYLTQVSRGALAEKESRRWADIMSLTINLEHVGDIIDKNLMELAEKKIRKRLSFSEAGQAEIADMHARVLANLQLALNVFINADLASAQRLIAEKESIRDLERRYADNHLQRLAEHTVSSIETSALHLDIMRDMKRINSHMCAIAYPILEEAGVLAPTRVRAYARERSGYRTAEQRPPGA